MFPYGRCKAARRAAWSVTTPLRLSPRRWRKDFRASMLRLPTPFPQARAAVDDYRGLAAYRKLGYVPCDQQDESASKTLDYAYDDRAVAAIAKAAGAARTMLTC